MTIVTDGRALTGCILTFGVNATTCNIGWAIAPSSRVELLRGRQSRERLPDAIGRCLRRVVSSHVVFGAAPDFTAEFTRFDQDPKCIVPLSRTFRQKAVPPTLDHTNEIGTRASDGWHCEQACFQVLHAALALSERIV